MACGERQLFFIECNKAEQAWLHHFEKMKWRGGERNWQIWLAVYVGGEE